MKRSLLPVVFGVLSCSRSPSSATQDPQEHALEAELPRDLARAENRYTHDVWLENLCSGDGSNCDFSDSRDRARWSPKYGTYSGGVCRKIFQDADSGSFDKLANEFVILVFQWSESGRMLGQFYACVWI